MQKVRRKYDSEFKHNALALVEKEGRSAMSVAESLGIKPSLLYRWRKESEERGNIAFSGNGNQALTADAKRIKELEKQLKDVQIEREILKKALAIFSKAQK